MREVSPMMPREHLSSDRRRLASELRALRESSGLSAARFGEPHGWSQGKVSKIEHGRTVPSREDVEKWAAAAGHPEMAEDLVKLAESVATQTRSYAGSAGPTLAARAEEAGVAEALATVTRSFQTAMVPGLLQTADYARAVLAMLDRPEEEIAPAVNARMQRQDALYRPGAHFEFILTEGALRWRPGPPEMMIVQYDRLVRVSRVESVELRVLPYSVQAPAFYDSPFTVFEIPDDPTVVSEGTPREQVYREEGNVETCRAAFRRCWEAALAGEDALAFIEGLQSEARGS